MYYRIFLIIITIGITFSVIPSITAAEEPIVISTSKDLYYAEDTIVVFGKITGMFGELPVTIQLYHDDSLIAVDQIKIALDGTFATDFKASGQYWKEDGTYIVRAFYTPTKIVEKTIQFLKEPVDSTSALFPVDIPNAGSFDVGYSIIGGELEDITLNQDHYSLLVEITSNTNGYVILKLPRENIDAKINDNEDEIFIVLVSNSGVNADDFTEVEFKEVEVGPDFRTLRIELQEGDKWIEIIGTYVIPEFGTIVTMILLIAVTTTIIMSKSKFSIKYN